MKRWIESKTGRDILSAIGPDSIAQVQSTLQVYTPDIIISGGQKGADMGGLLGAKAVGIATGGYAPTGWKTEKGPCTDLGSVFGLIEDKSPDYAVRTRHCVAIADAIILVAYDFESPGSALTVRLARAKPLYQVPFSPHLGAKLEPFKLVDDVKLWLHQIKPAVLMIAGNRESKAYGIEEYTKQLLLRIFA